MKNINIINKMVATATNLPLKTVEAVNKIYWKEISKNLTSLSDQAVHIKKIGTIEISAFKVKKQILRNIEQIKKLRTSPKFKEDTKIRGEIYLKESLTKLLIKRNQFAIEFKNKQEKNDRRISEHTTPNMVKS